MPEAPDRIKQLQQAKLFCRVMSRGMHNSIVPLTMFSELALDPRYRSNAEVMRGLLGAVRDYARMHCRWVEKMRFLQGGYPTDDQFQLSDLLQKSSEKARHYMDPKNAEIHLPGVGDISIKGSMSALVCAISELFINGLGACPDERSLRVELSQEGSGVWIRIEDEGPGFSKEALDHAFTPFFSTNPAGFGLGLLVAREVIESVHGQLLLPDQPGSPGVVRIFLPR